MPDGVHEFYRFQLVKDDAARVTQAARQHEPQPGGSHRTNHGDDGQYDGPSGNDVKDHGDFFEPIDADGV